MRLLTLAILSLLIGLNLSAQTDARSTELLQNLAATIGSWSDLAQLQDVEFTYTYESKGAGTDISTERYIFNDEASWAHYSKHEVNVMPGTGGEVTQVYMDGEAALTHDGTAVSDAEAIGGTEFLRAANYYWFTMNYKLNDPGTNHEYLGSEEVNGIAYEKVRLTFDGSRTGKEQNDGYILYFNPETHLIDRFYFSLPAMGVEDIVILMELSYEQIDGVYVSTQRDIYMPTPSGDYQLGLVQTTENVRFNNGFEKSALRLR